VTVEFTAESGAESTEAKEVFSYDGKTVYRYERDVGSGPSCACELIEGHGPPVRHTEADASTVVLSFVAPTLDDLRDITADLRERYDGVSLRRLTRSADVGAGQDLVFVDRAALTDRQREVLETAHEMGYFEHPKEANATEVAAVLDINRSTFAEHLAAAQSKLLDALLDR
jgi:predicted DNA binding protein